MSEVVPFGPTRTSIDASRRGEGSRHGGAYHEATAGAGPEWITPVAPQWHYAPRVGPQWTQLTPDGGTDAT
jgi:hypothetical protein